MLRSEWVSHKTTQNSTCVTYPEFSDSGTESNMVAPRARRVFNRNRVSFISPPPSFFCLFVCCLGCCFAFEARSYSVAQDGLQLRLSSNL